jgi:hypothetical protein
MATSSLIQKLFGLDESNVGEDSVSVMNRRCVEKYVVSSVGLPANAAASLDVVNASSNGQLGYLVCKADATHPIPVGVSLQSTAGAEGDKVDICVRGICEALVDGSGVAVAVGDALTISSSGGKLIKRTAAEEPLVAYAIDASSADATSTVYVCGMAS